MIALDLFAGHGWGVACQRLGIEEYGVEIMPEARAIRAANSMRTSFADVWDALLNAPIDSPAFRAALQIASPPCQTFSMAGGGAGRRALDEVLALIDERAYLRPADLHFFGEKHDPSTALVLTPLALVARDAPTYVVWEQVPPVLPVWERAAVEMREWGYSVWTGILNAEQYGVPQTRRRAVLIARADGKKAEPPKPTHSRYYSHDPKRLDSGVLPWVSMADALGWGGEWLYAGAGATAVHTAGQRQRPTGEPAHTMTGKGTATRVSRPAPMVTGGGAATGGAEVFGRRGRDIVERLWHESRPATTVMGDARVMAPGHKINAEDRTAGREYPGRPEGATRVTVAEAAALQSYPADFVWNVMVDTPRGPKPITKTKQFLTIGNAVPPLMAEAILKAAIS